MSLKITPYLHFNGDCATAFETYAALMGGVVEMKMTYGESPMAEQCGPGAKDRMMHVSMTIAGQRLMGSDSPTEEPEKPHGMSVAISIEDLAQAEKVFAGLAEGGEVAMPLTQTFWAERFGMVTDRFGIPWMISGGAEG